MIKVSIIGGTGYTGKELIKILLHHQEVNIRHITSEKSAGLHVSSVHKELKDFIDLKFEKFNWNNIKKDTDIVFLALPHGITFNYINEILESDVRVIDFSADFRIKDVATYEHWYKVKHNATDYLKEAVYGLPEFYRNEIKGARIIANPGCYATATILALAPILKNKLVDSSSIVVDAKSGVSGAGKKLDMMYHFNEANENLSPYAVTNHRHVPEICQVLKDISKEEVKISFVPHLIPMNRGILSNVYATAVKDLSLDSLHELYTEFYKNEKFVRILDKSVFPSTKDVFNTNFCNIGLSFDMRTNKVIIISAIDNLMKGASSQAVQNMNIICGFQEDLGL